MTLTAHEIALAFGQQNTRKAWTARPNTIGGETVHFTSTTGIVALVYQVEHGRWVVKFNKFQATWGDYVKAVARSLYVVLSTLKSAGLPFEAPEGPDGIEIVTTATSDATTYVRWPGATPPAQPIMPELRFTAPAAQMLAQLQNGAAGMQATHDALIKAGAVWDGTDGYGMTGATPMEPE